MGQAGPINPSHSCGHDGLAQGWAHDASMSVRCNFKVLFLLLRIWEGEADFPLELSRKQVWSCW